jgi:hypothetical protein
MRFPAPSITLLMAPSQISHLETTHLVAPTAPPFTPFDPNLITPVPCPRSPSIAVIPLYDPLVHSTPPTYARLFDQVGYGDSPKTIDESTTRFVLNNPNLSCSFRVPVPVGNDQNPERNPVSNRNPAGTSRSGSFRSRMSTPQKAGIWTGIPALPELCLKYLISH